MVRKTSGRLLICSAHSAWSSVSHDGAGLQGGSAKHATGVPGQGIRRPSVPAPDAAEAARHAELGPASGPAPCPRTATGRRLQQHQRMMKPCRPPAPDGARTVHPGPESTGRRSRNRVLLATRCSRSYLWRSVQPIHASRAWHFSAAAENDATARHTTASRPPSAPPQGNDASPSQHGTAPPPRATPHRASSSIPSPLRCSPCARDLYRNSSRKSTRKRIRRPPGASVRTKIRLA